MIAKLVDWALDNRFIIIIAAVLLFGWGAISFHNLPVEAYPDVANNYVTVITQWPGRASEEVEQQVTVPLEIAVAGIPHMTHLRSTSLAGLSSVTMIFDDESTNDWNRAKVLERLSQVTLPAGLQPQMGTDWSPVGQIFWYTLKSTDPRYGPMELKSIEDWQLEKQFRSVPGVVDVSSFGGITREYQVILDPQKLVAYGLSVGQVKQQLAANNTNAGGSFIEQGEQQINVREVGLFTTTNDIAKTVLKTQNGTALKVSDIAKVVEGPKIRLGQIGKTIRREDGKLVDDGDVVEGVVLLHKGDDSDGVLVGIHDKVKELNDHILPKGVRDRSLPRSKRPSQAHDAYGAGKPHRRHLPRLAHPVPLPRQRARRPHRRHYDSLFAALRRHLPRPRPHPRQPALARRARLRHGRRRRGGHGRKHRPPSQSRQPSRTEPSEIRFARPPTKSSGRSSTRSPSSSPPISPYSPCSRSRDACSSRWPGPSPSPFSALSSSQC